MTPSPRIIQSVDTITSQNTSEFDFNDDEITEYDQTGTNGGNLSDSGSN